MKLNGKGLIAAVILAALALFTNCAGFRNLTTGNQAYFSAIFVNATGEPGDKQFRVETELKAVLGPAGQHEAQISCPSWDNDLYDPRRDGRCTITVTDQNTGEVAGGSFRVEADDSNLFVATRNSRGELELDDDTFFQSQVNMDGSLVSLVDLRSGTRFHLVPRGR